MPFILYYIVPIVLSNIKLFFKDLFARKLKYFEFEPSLKNYLNSDKVTLSLLSFFIF